jgi:hypothetical protein
MWRRENIKLGESIIIKSNIRFPVICHDKKKVSESGELELGNIV